MIHVGDRVAYGGGGDSYWGTVVCFVRCPKSGTMNTPHIYCEWEKEPEKWKMGYVTPDSVIAFESGVRVECPECGEEFMVEDDYLCKECRRQVAYF